MVLSLIVIGAVPLSIGLELCSYWRGTGAGYHLGAALLASLLALERLFRMIRRTAALSKLMLLPLPLPAVVLAKVMANWVVTGLPLPIPPAAVMPLLGMDMYSWKIMALTLLLERRRWLPRCAGCVDGGLKRGGALLSVLVLPPPYPY